MAEEIKVPGLLRPGTGDYHSYSKDIIDDQLRNKTQSELNALFNQGKGLDENGNIVPIGGGTSNADDIPYTENIPSSQHTAGSTGKKIKQLEDRIDALVPTEEPTLGEIVDLSNYMMNGNVALSFTFDSNKKYVYEGRVTSMCTYARNNTSYAAFKVVDIDKYITYTISGNTFTYYGQLDSETLPNEARSKFELGRYALVKQLQGATGDSWVDGTAGVFVDTNDRPMAFKYVASVEINSQTINNVLLARTSNDSHIYVYRLTSGLFKFYAKVASSNAAFGELNKLIVGSGGGDITGAAVNGSEVPKNGTILQFPTYPTSDTMSYSDSTNYDAGSIGRAVKDAKVAANVSFDDTVTQLGTQQNPVNNIQDAIQVIVSNVTGTTGRLTVTLQYSNTIGIANKKCKIVVYYQGVVYKPNTFPVDDEFTTDSNGNIILNLPLGSTYTITPIDIEDYITPEDISGIVDDNCITKSLIYNAVSNNERILFVVNIKNVSPQITVNNKKLYIDIYDTENLGQVLTEKAYTCTLGNDGTPKLIEDHLGNIIATGKTLYFEIPKGTKIKAYLQTWDGTDSLVQEYMKSSDVVITANKNKDTITLYYSNVNYGLYLLLKDSTKEKGYSKNKILEVDSTNNRFTCNIGGYNYTIYKENSKVYRILEGTSEPEEWLSNTTEAEIMLGVGISSSQTNTIEAKDDITIEQGFLTLDFFVPRVVQYERGVLVNGTSMPVFDHNDGMYITRRLSEYNETVRSALSQTVINNHKKTLYVGDDEFIIQGFIPSSLQFSQFIANYTAILIVTNVFSGSPITKPIPIATYTYVAVCNSDRNTSTMTSVVTYDINLNGLQGWLEITQNHQFYVFYPFA